MGIYNLGGGGGQPVLQAKQVTPSVSQQIILPDDGYDGLSKVDIAATPLETRAVNPSTSSQIITPSSNSIGFSSVTVNPMRLQSKSVTPSTVPYSVSPDSGYNGLSSVTFGRDANLTADNIVSGKSIYGVSGTYEGAVSITRTVLSSPPSGGDKQASLAVDIPASFKKINGISFYHSDAVGSFQDSVNATTFGCAILVLDAPVSVGQDYVVPTAIEAYGYAESQKWYNIYMIKKLVTITFTSGNIVVNAIAGAAFGQGYYTFVLSLG